LRKERRAFWYTIDLMDKLPKHHWTVSKVLRKYPHATAFFLTRALRCPGCGLNRHCTLSDVACSYGLDAPGLTSALREACSVAIAPE
jgi:hypothetical protein